ncbi:MAG: hypothetical protein Q7R94_02685 [bacterium]|nr:hypothetical protein [bacterium]
MTKETHALILHNDPRAICFAHRRDVPIRNAQIAITSTIDH